MKRFLTRALIKTLAVTACLSALAGGVSATTVKVPSDDEMIVTARAIVIARVLSVTTGVDQADDRVYTYTTLRIKEVLKGEISERKIVLKEQGGDLGYRGTMVYGSPRYNPGEKVLVYLNTWLDGTLRTHQMYLGKFNITVDQETGARTVVRSLPDSEVVVVTGDAQSQTPDGVATERMKLSEYKQMVRERLAANSARSEEYAQKYYRDIPVLSRPDGFDAKVKSGEFGPQFTFLGPARWFEPDTGLPVIFTVNTDNAPAGALTDLDAVMNVWSNVAGCALRVQRDSQTTTACGPSIGLNTIIFNGCDGRWGAGPSCSGILALGGLSWTGETKVVNGTTFRRATAGFVSFNPWCPNSPCGVHDVTTQMVATHELGHALGLGHSWQPSFGGSPTADQLDATMYYIAKIDRCALLKTDDINGIVFIYPGTGGGSALSIATSSLPGGTTGTAYSQNLTASGGTSPYSWSLASGSGPLPTGLTLSAGGAITGTPTVAGTFNFTARVADSASGSAQKALSIVISSPGTAYNSQFVSQSVPSSVNAGQTFTASFNWTNNGTQTWNGSAGFTVRSQNPAGNTTWGGSQVNLTGASWAPGQTMSINVNFVAPSTPGTYNFQWQCNQSGVGYFGQMSTNVAIQVLGSGGGGSDGASFSTQSVPGSLTAGQVTTVSVTMTNTGTTTWTQGAYVLGSLNPAGNTTWGLSQVALPQSVSPSSSVTFAFNITAPSVAGTYNFQWGMLHNGTAFGTASTNVAIVVSTGGGGGGSGDNAQFMSHNMPSSLNPGQAFSVTVTMKNTGTTTWGTTTHKLGSQNPANNTTWGLSRATLPKSVPPGSSTSIKFTVTAPTSPGNYNFQWQMVNNNVYFGQAMPNVAVQVGSGGGGADGATFVSQSVPTTMNAGQSVAVSVTMRNSGTTTWQPGTYSLGSLNPAGNTVWGMSSVNLASSTAPGANATFSFNVSAPTSAGSYNFQWGMKNGATSFGSPSTNVVVVVSASTSANNAQFVSQSVPSSMTAGQGASVNVVMNNNGSTTWMPGSYTLVSRNPAGNTVWGPSTVALSSTVPPGGNATFAFSITAPNVGGTYNFQWQMQQGSTAFGAMSTNVGVVVSGGGGGSAPLVISTTTLPNGTLGVTYNAQIVATGGVQPYTWSISSGALPAGLTLNSSTGVLSGKTSASATISITVMVRDANGTTATKSYKFLFK